MSKRRRRLQNCLTRFNIQTVDNILLPYKRIKKPRQHHPFPKHTPFHLKTPTPFPLLDKRDKRFLSWGFFSPRNNKRHDSGIQHRQNIIHNIPFLHWQDTKIRLRYPRNNPIIVIEILPFLPQKIGLRHQMSLPQCLKRHKRLLPLKKGKIPTLPIGKPRKHHSAVCLHDSNTCSIHLFAV